jgi:TRAP-type mannitol/chloroaromatic compound transport system permease small subunit
MTSAKPPAAGWIRALDRLAQGIGTLVSWLALAMIALGAYNALARYLGRWLGRPLASNSYLELQWYLFSAIFLLAAGWLWSEDRHVRVDVLYSRLGDRGKVWLDLAGTALLLLPFLAVLLWTSWPAVANSWAVRETSPDPGGLARWPIKALVPIGIALLALQAIAEVGKRIARLRRPTAEDAR